MNKSKLFFKTCFLAVAMCAAAVAANAQVFVIERGTQFQSFATLNAAVEALQDGDKIYIPPGVHGIPSATIVFDVPNVTIIGTGYVGGDASAFASFVRFQADGITVTGIRFNNTTTLFDLSDLTMTRCLIVHFSTDGALNSIVISECDFIGGAYLGTGMINTTVSKSIFRSQARFRGCEVFNCLFLPSSFSSFENNSYNTFRNNIFVDNQNYTVLAAHTTFRNNMWVGGTATFSGDNLITSGNIMGVTSADTFTDFDAGDYTLKVGNPGIGAGSDDTDIGIFGTQSPFKASRMPANPIFMLRHTDAETDETGNLPVKIIVEAQER